MLQNIPLPNDSASGIHAMIAQMNGNAIGTNKLATGIYEIGHFSFDNMFPSGTFTGYGEYGVCDDYKQILKKYPEIEDDPDKKYVISITCVSKANQHPEGGWRWHKWGEYIGDHTPQHEYLYDEEGIEKVYCFHVHELA